MADSSFGLKIGLEGEREFKRAITDINRSMRVLGSELKLVASQFGKNETSAASLTARNEVLGRQIESQRDKVATLKAALDNANSSFGESDSRTKNWQIQLNNAQATLNSLERELSENEKAIDGFNDEAKESDKDLKDAARGADRLEGEVDDLGDEMDQTSHKTSLFGDVLKANLTSQAITGGIKAIGSALASVGRGLAEAVKDGVSYNAEMESYTTSFTTMLGDQARAQQLVNELKREAAATPFGMRDLADSAQTLMSFGMSADKALLHMRQLGDISQGDSEKFKSLTLAFAQMSSTGKLTGQDLNQMINAGFNPLEEISRKTGKSIGELKEEMGKGAISADMVADAFASATAEGGRFYQAMENQSHTFTGQLSTLQDNVAALKGQLTEGLTTMLALSVMPMLNGWVEALSTGFETGGVRGLVDALGGIIKEALAFITDLLPDVIDTGISIVTALLEGIIDALPAVAEAASQLILSLVDALAGLLPQIMGVAATIVATLVGGIADGLPQLVPAVVGGISGMVQALADSLPAILDAALQLVQGLADGLLAAIPVLIEALPGIIQAIVDFLISGVPQLIETVTAIIDGIVTALPEVITALVEALPTIVEALVNGLAELMPLMLQAGLDLFTSLIGALPQIIEALVAAIPQIITALLSAITTSLPQLIQAGIELLTSLITDLPQIIATIIGALPQIIEAVVGGIMGAIPQLIQAGIGLLTALIGALPQIIATIVAAIPQIIVSLVSAIGSSAGSIVMAGVNLLVGLVGNLPAIIAAVISAVPQIVSAIVGAFGDLMWRITDIGANIARGLWDGIQSLAGWLWNKVSGWVSGIWDGICDFFGIHSPSRQMAWVGSMLVQGLSGAIDKDGNKAVRSAKHMAQDVHSAFDTLAQGVTVPMDIAPAVLSVPELAPTSIDGGFSAGNRASFNSSGGLLADIHSLLASSLPELIAAQNLQVVLDDGTLVGRITPKIDARLARLQRRSAYT